MIDHKEGISSVESRLGKAQALRNDPNVHYNCAQSVLIAFADRTGVPEDKLFDVAMNFGGGMKTGSVCGAVTGALMALGLMGKNDPETVRSLMDAVKDAHDGHIRCADLLQDAEQSGMERKTFCDGMVAELVRRTAAIVGETGQ